MNGAAAAAVAAAVIANAIKASGAIVRVRPEEFEKILRLNEESLVVHAIAGGVFWKRYRYLTSYKGLVFYTSAREEMTLPGRCQVILAKKIWTPS